MASGVLHPQQRLPSGLNFKDAFWDDQNKGVDIILSRLRKSKDTCEEIKKLYELRANIEQDYGERLLKLAQASRLGVFEENSFAETLSRIPATLEITARAHIDLAQQLKDHLEAPLDGFLRDQRDVRKMQQQHIENSKQLKNLHETDVARAKDYYSTECVKLKSMEKYIFDLKKNNNSSMEEITKIEKEIEEQRRLVAVAEQVYKRSIDNLNTVNEKWVNSWISSANVFQDMEIEKMSYLRNTLWSFSNMMTSTFVIDEECCDRIRTALEITDIEQDITAFVQRYGTGNRMPVPLKHEIFYHFPSTSINSANTLPMSNEANTIEQQQQQQPLSAPLLRTVTSENNSTINGLPSAQQPITTILTNPDEELKSVERQLQQLEVQSTTPKAEKKNNAAQYTSSQTPVDEKSELIKDNDDRPQPLSGVTNTTDQSNGPFSTAIREVEQILNQEKPKQEDATPTMTPPASGEHEEHKPVAFAGNPSIAHEQHVDTTQQALPSTTAPSLNLEKAPSVAHSISGDFSSGVYNALGIKDQNTADQHALAKQQSLHDHSVTQLAPLSSETLHLSSSESLALNNVSAIAGSETTNQTDKKYKPMPNPAYSHTAASVTSSNREKTGLRNAIPETAPNQQRPIVGVRTSSLILPGKSHSQDSRPTSSLINSRNISPVDDNNVKDEDDDDKEATEYQSRMPHPPPKDEKWVISSIRRPQQLPVRASNATMFDGTVSIKGSMIASPPLQSKDNMSLHNNIEQQQFVDPANTTSSIPVAVSAVNNMDAPDITNSGTANNNATFDSDKNDTTLQHVPKVHRPVVPLTIDIPNSVKPQPDQALNAAQKIIAEGKRRSQASPMQQQQQINNDLNGNNDIIVNKQQSMDRNVMRGYITNQNEMLDDGGIRPAPWQNEYHSEGIASNGNMNSYNRGANMMSAPYATNINNGHQNYMPNMSGVRSSSTKPSDQVVPQQQHEEENVNKKRFGKNKQYLETSGKSKESKTGRFSLGFFSNKKEKKKEKEAAAAAAAAAASSSQQDHLQQQRPMSQQIMYQQSLISQESSRNDLKGQYSNSNNPTHPAAQQSMTQAYIPDHTRFIGYAKAQWSFEATIEGEMSFFADEVLGIIRKQMDGWWEAERLGPVNAGQRGLIPGNYMLDNQPQP